MSAQRRLGTYGKTNVTGIALKEERPIDMRNSRLGGVAGDNRQKVLRELEIVTSKETTISPVSNPSS